MYKKQRVQKQEVDNCIPICYLVGIQMSTWMRAKGKKYIPSGLQ